MVVTKSRSNKNSTKNNNKQIKENKIVKGMKLQLTRNITRGPKLKRKKKNHKKNEIDKSNLKLDNKSLNR